jgi:hypothetical protein
MMLPVRVAEGGDKLPYSQAMDASTSITSLVLIC